MLGLDWLRGLFETVWNYNHYLLLLLSSSSHSFSGASSLYVWRVRRERVYLWYSSPLFHLLWRAQRRKNASFPHLILLFQALTVHLTVVLISFFPRTSAPTSFSPPFPPVLTLTYLWLAQRYQVGERTHRAPYGKNKEDVSEPDMVNSYYINHCCDGNMGYIENGISLCPPPPLLFLTSPPFRLPALHTARRQEGRHFLTYGDLSRPPPFFYLDVVGTKLIATKNIALGEEINYDYVISETNPEWKINCKCNTKACR